MSKQHIIPILLLPFFLAACSEEAENTIPGQSVPVEVEANIHKTTRSNTGGDAFVNGDTFELYEGAPITGNTSSTYTFDTSAWTGNPVLYWDDLNVWSGGRLITGSTYFTAIMTNGGTLTTTAGTGDKTLGTFSVAADQNASPDDAEYVKNDLLVAYANAQVSNAANRKLSLTFDHAFAHLVIKVTEETPESTPAIMGDETVFTLNGVNTGSNIELYHFVAITMVTAVADGETSSVILRNISGDAQGYLYEAIIPAQSLESGVTLSITNNSNGKEYTYDLSGSTSITGETDKAEMLKQGHTTTLSLKIEKTEIQSVTATLKEWATASVSADATPTDYPIIELGDGGGDDGDDDGSLDPSDDYAGKTIRLTSDIDASKLNLPIGTKEYPFRGIFDGQGYTIRNVDLDSDIDFMGVFGYTDGAAIKNVNIEGITLNNTCLNSSTATGGLAGYINNTLIENCHVREYTNGVTAGYDNAGGLVGYVNGSSIIRNSSAAANVTARHDYAGGLIGQSKERMKITECFATGDATATNYAGGLIGYTAEGEITFSYAWGSATANRYAGGMIGRAKETALSNSYAAAPQVKGGSRQGGLIGYSETPVSHCYWNAASLIGLGVMGVSLDNTNSSFTLTKVKAAMNNVLNSLNTTGETLNDIWTLTEATEYQNYFLPTLCNNTGEALLESNP